MRYSIMFAFTWLSAASLIGAFCMIDFGRDQPSQRLHFGCDQRIPAHQLWPPLLGPADSVTFRKERDRGGG
jgi:hypothetical protein